MKSFYEWLALEFDPNRGAAGRAIPLVPHYATDDEFRVGSDRADGRMRLKSRKRKSIESLSEPWRNAYSAYQAGRAEMRWQGSGSGTSEEERRAHKAGRSSLRQSYQRPAEDADALPSGTLSAAGSRMDWEDRLSNMTPWARTMSATNKQLIKQRYDRGGVGAVMSDIR